MCLAYLEPILFFSRQIIRNCHFLMVQMQLMLVISYGSMGSFINHSLPCSITFVYSLHILPQLLDAKNKCCPYIPATVLFSEMVI